VDGSGVLPGEYKTPHRVNKRAQTCRTDLDGEASKGGTGCSSPRDVGYPHPHFVRTFAASTRSHGPDGARLVRRGAA